MKGKGNSEIYINILYNVEKCPFPHELYFINYGRLDTTIKKLQLLQKPAKSKL